METKYTKIEAHTLAWKSVSNQPEDTRGQFRVIKNRGYYEVIYGRKSNLLGRFRFKA